MNIIEIKNLSYYYDDKKALDNISLTIPKGQVTAVLGGNGAGKSTLFLNMNGVLKPNSGEIYLDGECINSGKGTKKAIYKDIGIVFQDPNDQIFSESVADDIAFGALNIGIDKKDIPMFVERVAKQTGCSDFLDKPVHELSFGQKKRVAIAGILIMQPKVIIMDEPTAGLDPEGVSQLLKLLMEIKEKNNITIIISTHDIDLIPLYCDYVYVLNKGKIAIEGNVDEVLGQSDIIRDMHLRTPRIKHLMEILAQKDNLPVNPMASTISQARKSIKSVFEEKEKYVVKGSQKLRYGYTTGSCATAAASAAAMMLLKQEKVNGIKIKLPDSSEVFFEIENQIVNADYCECSVTKHAGDDPDVTDGAKIYARVEFSSENINVLGGKGVGVVTQEGLQCKVGQPAINPVPLKMIKENCINILKENNCEKGLTVTISVENGEEIAKKTFNPRLGILGGISILGTTGIVEPMSEKALVDTIKIMIDKRYLHNKDLILITPGNYGQNFCENYLNIKNQECEKVSNYIGEALDYIKYKKFGKILLVGHIGKLVKLAAGVMNTHSSVADCRTEIIALYSMILGGNKELSQKILDCNTTQQAVELLQNESYFNAVMDKIMDKIIENCNYRLNNQVEIAAVMFDNKMTTVVKSKNADKMIKLIKEQN